LFAKTDEILHFALEGEGLVFGSDGYDQKRRNAAEVILQKVEEILEALSQYPQNDCQAVRESAARIKALAKKI